MLYYIILYCIVFIIICTVCWFLLQHITAIYTKHRLYQIILVYSPDIIRSKATALLKSSRSHLWQLLNTLEATHLLSMCLRNIKKLCCYVASCIHASILETSVVSRSIHINPQTKYDHIPLRFDFRSLPIRLLRSQDAHLGDQGAREIPWRPRWQIV